MNEKMGMTAREIVEEEINEFLKSADITAIDLIISLISVFKLHVHLTKDMDVNAMINEMSSDPKDESVIITNEIDLTKDMIDTIVSNSNRRMKDQQGKGSNQIGEG